MSTENGYSPAMPSSVSRSDDGNIVSSRDFDGFEGLSKREHFAGLAMQAVVTADLNMNMTERDAAAFAVLQADALLKALAE